MLEDNSRINENQWLGKHQLRYNYFGLRKINLNIHLGLRKKNSSPNEIQHL